MICNGQRDENYENLLKICTNGDLEGLKKFESLGLYINGDIDKTPPLYMALSFNKFDIAKFLLEHGADINNKFYNGMYGYKTTFIQMLVDSIATGFYDKFLDKLETESIAFLIDNGADVNIIDEEGYTPLDWSVMYNHHTAEELIKNRGGKFTKEFLFSNLYKRKRPNSNPNIEPFI